MRTAWVSCCEVSFWNFTLVSVEREKVNDLTDFLLRDYLANPFRENSLGIVLRGTFLEIYIIKV